jgi:hypothetical protein
MAMWKRLMDNGPELSVRIKVAFSESSGNMKAHTELVKQIRDVFNVKPFEQGGLTEVETIDLLNHFLIYVGSIKKNSSGYPTPPEEGTSGTSDSPSDDCPPTPNGSGCPSTGSGPSSEALEPSPSEQESR